MTDTNKFPFLTRSIDSIDTSSDAATARAPLARSVEQALREVLGWRPKTDDTKAFVAALNRSFTCTEVRGATECTWTPRTYAASVRADMGDLTGAQASVYAQAKIAVEQAITLLDGLTPLRVDADPQDIEAARAIARSDLTELLDELGTEGGPRRQRVDRLLEDLVGYDPNALERSFDSSVDRDDLEQEDDELHLVAQLQRRFGMIRDLVNTIDEERTLTDFMTFADYVDQVASTWNANRDFFGHEATEAFLGTELVRLSWELGVMAESVQELCFLLDSVFVGPAERQTLVLDLDGTKLTISELLDWVREFSAEEAPRLIEDAGKDGVRRFKGTLDELHDLIEAAEESASKAESNPTEGFHTERVAAGFKELRIHIETAQTSADRILGIETEEEEEEEADENPEPKPEAAVVERGSEKHDAAADEKDADLPTVPQRIQVLSSHAEGITVLTLPGTLHPYAALARKDEKSVRPASVAEEGSEVVFPRLEAGVWTVWFFCSDGTAAIARVQVSEAGA